MKDERIYADLNKWEEVNGQFRVILTTQGTHQDLHQYGITLKEGLTLAFWMDDEDAKGNPDPLYFDGTIHRSEDRQNWVAVVVREDIRNASEVKSFDDTAQASLASDPFDTHIEYKYFNPSAKSKTDLADSIKKI